MTPRLTVLSFFSFCATQKEKKEEYQRKSRAKRGGADIQIAERSVAEMEYSHQRKSRCGGKPPHPLLGKMRYCAYVRLSVLWLTRYCMNAFCCQAAVLNTLFIRMAVLFLFFYHPWQPMRALHGTAVRTLTSEARGCKLLNGGAKRSKDGTCMKRKEKEPKRKEKHPVS